MGPMAGVLLQRLIIDFTPAIKDQDHFQVVCFTNPRIPDRTASLSKDGGESYLRAVRETVKILEGCGADVVAIPCNTAHARLSEIMREVSVPVANMVEAALADSAAFFPEAKKLGLLATDGTLRERIYQTSPRATGFEWLLPTPDEQKEVMEVIYTIKAGKHDGMTLRIAKLCDALIGRGADRIVLGCTELSLLYEDLAAKGLPVLDPLRSLAKKLIRLAREEEAALKNRHDNRTGNSADRP